jgi:SAM-dependent methyltransferase
MHPAPDSHPPAYPAAPWTPLRKWVARLAAPAASALPAPSFAPNDVAMPAAPTIASAIAAKQSGPAFDRAARVARLADVPLIGRLLAALAASPSSSQTAAEAHARADAALARADQLGAQVARLHQNLLAQSNALAAQSAAAVQENEARANALAERVASQEATTARAANLLHAQLTRLATANRTALADAQAALQKHQSWRSLRDAEHQEHLTAIVERVEALARAHDAEANRQENLSAIVERVEALARAHDAEANRQELARLAALVESLAAAPRASNTSTAPTVEIATRLGRIDAQYDQLSRLGVELEGLRTKLGGHLQAVAATNNTVAALARDALGEPIAASEIAKFYTDLENRFRGSREEIKEKLRYYVNHLREAGAGTAERPILDLGCGRGEFVELLRDERWAVKGVDNNLAQLEVCRQHLLDVTRADLVEHLRSLRSESLGALAALHVAEHLPTATLVTMLREAARVLKPGGLFILETPNPENLLVASLTFHYDPTHRHPIPPDLLQWMVEWCGFAPPEIHRLNPWKGRALADLDSLAFREINHLLYGPMDYAVIGRKQV